MKCIHCGRPFVDTRLFQAHSYSCMKQKQAELDKKWNEGQEFCKYISKQQAKGTEHEQ